jgi:hypothetical protein
LHWFPVGRAPEGLWIGPTFFADVARTQNKESGGGFFVDTSSSSHQYLWGARASLGYNFIAANGFTVSISLSTGIGFSNTSSTANGSAPVSSTGQSLNLSSQIGLGWAL